MVLIGFVLLAAAAALGIDIVAQNRFDLDVDVFGQLIATTPAGLFVTGVVTGLVAALGIMLLRDGLIRRRRLAKDAKHAHVEHKRSEVDDSSIDVRDRDRDRDRDRVTTF
jgi:hypothetical protein